MSIWKQYLDVGNDYFMQMIIQKVIWKKYYAFIKWDAWRKGCKMKHLNRNEGNMQLANADPLQGSRN